MALPFNKKPNRNETRDQEVARLIRVYGLSRNGHSHFSPSGSAGWLNCRAYLLANAKKPDDAGEDAAYGTVVHEIAAVWLRAIQEEGRKRAEHVPERFLGFTKVENGFRITCDASMLHHIRRYIEWCQEIEPLGDVYVEQRVDFSDYTPIPKQGGTADHFVATFGHLYITDLKMGVGIPVYVEWNTQALLYALGVWIEWNWVYGFRKITLRICQPRLDYFKEWTIDIETLLEWAETIVRPAADAAWKEEQARSPGPKQCQWCADIDCAARSKLLEDIADDYFGSTHEVDVVEGRKILEYTEDELDDHAASPLFGDLMPDKEPRFNRRMSTSLLSWRLKHRKMFDKYFREIEAELIRRRERHEHVPDWKISEGRKSYNWRDEDMAVNRLVDFAGVKRSELYLTEVTSVNQAKELLKTKGWKPKQIEKLLYEPDTNLGAPSLVITNPGKPTLVPATDDRPDLEDEVDDLFG